MFREKDTKSNSDTRVRDVVAPLSEFTGTTPTTPRVVVPSPIAVSRQSTPTPTPTPSVTPRDTVEPRSEAQTDSKRLTVGRGISLKGKISSCDRLVIEGNVEAELENCHTVEVTENGRFTGAAEIAGADISGHYEGALTVRDNLMIRGTGRVSGTVRYGRLHVEDGGEINGDFKTMIADTPKLRSGTGN
jgi:cytoskeletal protein CcmA (bactofilin family)